MVLKMIFKKPEIDSLKKSSGKLKSISLTRNLTRQSRKATQKGRSGQEMLKKKVKQKTASSYEHVLFTT